MASGSNTKDSSQSSVGDEPITLQGAIDQKNEKLALQLYEERQNRVRAELDDSKIPLILPEIEGILKLRNLIRFTDTTTTPGIRQVLNVSILRPPACEGLSWITIPQNLYSAETYAFLGFTDKKSTDLWSVYTGLARIAPFDFLTFATSAVREVTAATNHEGKDCRAYLTDIGVSKDMINSILRPECHKIKSTQDCQQWFLDALQLRWEELVKLPERIIRGLISNELDDALSNSQQRSPSTKGHHSGEHLQPVLRLENNQSNQALSIEQNSVFDLLADQDGINYLLWRGGTEPSLNKIYNASTNEVRIESMQKCPGDFSGAKAAFYLAQDAHTAIQYAIFHCILVDFISNPALMEFSFPKDQWQLSAGELTLMSLLYGEESNPSTELWKKVVWGSRRGERLQRILPMPSKPPRVPDFISGHIAAGRSERFRELKSHTELSINDCLVFDQQDSLGEIQQYRPRQLAIISDNALYGFEELMARYGHCRIRTLEKEMKEIAPSLGLLIEIKAKNAGLQELINSHTQPSLIPSQPFHND